MRDFQEAVRFYYQERFKDQLMNTWQYKKVMCKLSEYEAVMEKNGEEGWEAYQIFEENGGRGAGFEIHFKRLTPPKKVEKQLLTENERIGAQTSHP